MTTEVFQFPMPNDMRVHILSAGGRRARRQRVEEYLAAGMRSAFLNVILRQQMEIDKKCETWFFLGVTIDAALFAKLHKLATHLKYPLSTFAVVAIREGMNATTHAEHNVTP